MRIVGVIPARLASTRLPRKMLRPIAGKPLLAWVAQAALQADCLDRVLVATDAEEIAALCREIGVPCQMTSPDLASGTDRVHAVALEEPADVYLNIQGDEPLLCAEQLQTLVELMRRPGVEVGTLATACAAHDVDNPNAVKVVMDSAGRALYFSRAAIPFDRDRSGNVARWKHLGFYGYTREALLRFPTLPASKLEVAERLEQLRVLEAGIQIHVAVTEHDSIGVDTEEDLQRVEQMLLSR
jgi:3-deoxy-manno-octulosonate cytidylyltransferase (CMP-KDO synthetase)